MKKPTPRPTIAALAPYPLDSSASTDSPGTANLQYNEHWAPLSEHVRNACIDALTSAHLYPETSAAPLRQAIARVHEIKADRIVCANGSSELIALLCQIYCGEGDEVVVSAHSYLYFRSASLMAGATPVTAASRGLAPTVDTLVDAVSERTRIVFVDNPQNPLGGYLDRDAISALRARLPSRVLLVIDAAYAEYADATDYGPGMDLAHNSTNTVILRTFSKIYGLAGLRIGWAYASHEVVDLIHRVRQPNNLSSVSIAAALAALEQQDSVAAVCRLNAARRRALSAEINAHPGLEALPSQTNFVLVQVQESIATSAAVVADQLAARGILVRPMGSYGLPACLRITIGSEHDQRRLLEQIHSL